MQIDITIVPKNAAIINKILYEHTKFYIPHHRSDLKVLSDYDMEKSAKMHWQRVLRNIMHGFISQEKADFFSHYNVDADESYHVAFFCFPTDCTLTWKKGGWHERGL